jgi:DNA (cytosine-5)-methyltransferase 1
MDDKKRLVSKLNEFLSIEEAAKFIGVSKNTLRAWEAKGKISVSRNPFNNFRIYNKDKLTELLREINEHE